MDNFNAYTNNGQSFRVPQIQRNSYVDIDKLSQQAENSENESSTGDTKPLEQSYERDSKWRPHLSWSFLSWSLQQRMEEQAAQREFAWRKIADKLGPLLISETGCTFGQGDFIASITKDQSNERAHERQPIYPHNNNNNSTISNNHHITSYSSLGDRLEHHDSTLLAKQNYDYDEEAKYYEHYKRAKRRCMTVSGVLISLILLLFTLIILMAFGILHR